MTYDFMEKFQGKYRIPSARAPFWDYGRDGAYFVTICTKYRKHYFGEVVNQRMQLSAIGKIADECWLTIPKIYPFVRLGVHVVMPNHVHGIIIIDKQEEESAPRSAPVRLPQNTFGPQSRNLASIIRGFKGSVTREAREMGISFAWLPRYHDRIIRNEQAYHTISRYIVNNPVNWKKDKFYR